MRKYTILLSVALMAFSAGCKGQGSSDGKPKVAVGIIECANSDIDLSMTAKMTQTDGGHQVTVTAVARCGNKGIQSAPIDVDFWWGESEYGTSDENGRYSVTKTTTEPLPDLPMVTVKLSDANSNMVRLKSMSVAVSPPQ